jgi:hypothetical protein
MKKMKTVFLIDRENGSLATELPVSGSEWVLAGEGTATLKKDGSAAMVRDGRLFKRMARKMSKNHLKNFRKNPDVVIHEAMFKDAVEGWEPCESAPDKKTGHWPGWIPVREDEPDDKHHLEAFALAQHWEDGTYELVGPKVRLNPHGLERHELHRHGADEIHIERSYGAIREWLIRHEEEGLVFHHPDGRVAKVRRKDFGISWNPDADPRDKV